MHIRISGVVQGVGMRPFIHAMASRYGLSGWVLNGPAGVEVEVEGPAEVVEGLLEDLRHEPPPLARVTAFESREMPPSGERGFEIRRSSTDASPVTLISPDASVCDDCLREMRDPLDRRHGYPFINCTSCGPRYTIIRGLPYDRDRTTMAAFEMCPDCRREYENPSDRRFHAQPVACSSCGPRVWLAGASGEEIASGEPIGGAAEILRGGMILAVKGLGGFHLAVDATSEEAVRRLRERKAREEKPLAVMSPDIETVRRFAEVSPLEERLLASPERPIVLLRKKPGGGVASSVAPRNGFLGVMLPYTPLHCLLMDRGFEALVMTSGNVTDEPICHENADALGRLAGIADAFLLHDRGIHIRTDDSIARVVSGDTRLVRRARGYAPRPVFLEIECPPILAVGPELKNTICLTRGREAFISHHIGDLTNASAYESLLQAVQHLEDVLGIVPEAVACDLHPAYLSTRYAREGGLPARAVQQHHAHIASCLAENGSTGPVIGVALDGAAYGDDGATWGGEFLVADLSGYRRAGHLEYVPLPGGDRAAVEPARMALSYLHAIHGPDLLDAAPDLVGRIGRRKAETLIQMIDGGVNSPPTSSAGRLFDAAASVVGLRDAISYEGQAAVELEGVSAPGESGSYPCSVSDLEGTLIVHAKDIIAALAEDVASGAGPEAAAARFHNAVVDMVVGVVLRVREATGLAEVALSGGVWQNERLLSAAIKRFELEGMKVHSHRLVPANDGGVSLGQAVVVASGGGTGLDGS